MRFIRRIRCILEGVHVNGPDASCPYCGTSNPPREVYNERRYALHVKLLRPFGMDPSRYLYGHFRRAGK